MSNELLIPDEEVFEFKDISNLRDEYKTWDARLIWNVYYPSAIFASTERTKEFRIYGVDKSSIQISRPKSPINSINQHNQAWRKGVPEYSITIFTKEAGFSFERMRRLSATDIPFDISLNLYKKSNNKQEQSWIDGYEEFLGCTVVNEKTNYDVASFPLREFECRALRHRIMETDYFEAIIEGDGTFINTDPWNGKKP